MSISIDPAGPTSESPVTFTFNGGSGCPDPVPTIDGTEFIFEVNNSSSGVCLGAPVPYQLDWTVGPLEAGEYRVTHINPPTQINETEVFVVVQGPTPTDPAQIPAIDMVGAVILTAALGLVAHRFLGGRSIR